MSTDIKVFNNIYIYIYSNYSNNIYSNSSRNVIGKQKHEMVNNLYIDIDCLNNLLSQYLYRLRDTHRFARLLTKLNGQYTINKLVFKNNVFFQTQFYTCRLNNNMC